MANTPGDEVDGSWDGIIGMHVRGEIEMSGTSLTIFRNRVSLVRYTNFAMPTE